MVMLTLTADNAEQVIPLGEILRDKVDLFTVNRLSLVGEGANLSPIPVEAYPEFTSRYLEAAACNPAMGYKDNFLNIARMKRGMKLFGGCTGYGCGAAFNFMAVLPDGEVHACRKFISLIGNIHMQSFKEIYDSSRASQYRQRPAACSGCPVVHVCGGCLAVAASFGGDIAQERDPYCFVDDLS